LRFPGMSSTSTPEGHAPHRHFFVAVRRQIGLTAEYRRS
jgi:hypothetical protein